MKTIIASVILLIALVISGHAETFLALPGEIKAEIDDSGMVTITIKGIGNIVKLVQYFNQGVQDEWKRDHKINNNEATFDASLGDRFQLIDDKKRYMSLTSTMEAANIKRFNLIKVRIDCSTGDCCLQIDPSKKGSENTATQ